MDSYTRRNKPEDYPLTEIAKTAEAAIKRGGFILQKWTCDGCERRVTGGTLNLLTHQGHCQHCNTITDLDVRGCNYALFVPSRPNMTLAEMERALGLVEAGVQ